MNPIHTVDAVTLGETMVALSPTDVGPLRNATSLRMTIAGAESNVAIGLSRLGKRVAWMGRVGDDEPGRLVLDRLRAESVDVSAAHVDRDSSTSLMLKERRLAEVARVTYYRSGLAGSRLAAEDIETEGTTRLIASARALHLTGITPALSATAHAAVRTAIDVARHYDVRVSFDVNYRRSLWAPERARKVLTDLLRRVDLVFATDEEVRVVTGEGDQAGVDRLRKIGPTEIVLKRGPAGASTYLAGGRYHQPALPVHAVDSSGAGDAFVAGYLAGHLDGLEPGARLSQAVRMGAFAITTDGGWEGLPTRTELELLDHVPRCAST